MLKEKILTGKTYLGIELGSTRIKASLIDDGFVPVASGSFEWENQFEEGYWTYPLDSIHKGVQACFANLVEDVLNKYGLPLKKVGAIGVSAMMHGYLAFDKDDNLLTPFRTWRNTTTEEAADILTDTFQFNIPQRWSIAHLYQAISDNEPHIYKIAHITTLAGYIHYLLTGRREVGIGDASGIFPINDGDYDGSMLKKFDTLIEKWGFSWDIKELLPEVRKAGEKGAYLTEYGARLLDPTGCFEPGIAVCPPEGDAGTGMVATNAVLPCTGNVSAGTSAFAMLVLEKPLKKLHRQIDIVTTPDGCDVAMVHCNNCCNELDIWVSIFGEFAELMGNAMDKTRLYELLYHNAMTGSGDGNVAYNYLTGEHITEISKGRPMYFRLPESNITLADFMKVQLYSAVATLTIGMDILFNEECVRSHRFSAHGGLFKVKGVAQQILANALKTPVSVAETAGEGGAWGMALIAAYMMRETDKSLGEWLATEVFCNMKTTTLAPDYEQSREFEEYMKRYRAGLEALMKLEEIV